MEGIGGDGASVTPPLPQWGHDAWRMHQYYLDKTTPHSAYRWIGTLVIAAIYCLRVYYVQGFYIVSYGLGIYLLNLLIGFLSPLVDPELEVSDGPLLPTKGSDEFKPFIRRLPEFKFWYSMTKAFCIAFVMSFFSVFDVPVFWPILLCYWIVLFVLTMRRQLAHMIKYKYIPFSFGKQGQQGKPLTFVCLKDNNLFLLSLTEVHCSFLTSTQDEADPEANPLIVPLDDGEGRTQEEITNRWFGQDIFAEAVEQGDLGKYDSDDEMKVDNQEERPGVPEKAKVKERHDERPSIPDKAKEKKINNAAGPTSTQLQASKAEDDFEIVPAPATD
ncbi:hypothetical protein CRYUN_Cryun06bG0039400 [Craigia yunnanensis]